MKLQTTEFYDKIAGQYNSHLTESDNNIRDFVSIEFKNLVKESTVLDFGGGTGLDLPWLLQAYKVFFLEPSVKMRTIAQNGFENSNKIFFIENNIDFNTWEERNLPFNEKVDGILMNFAVLNCIKNIDRLFEKLALVCNEQAVICALVIDDEKIETNLIKSLAYSIIGKPVMIYNNNKGIGHKTYLHTRKQIKSASGKWFNSASYTAIEFSNFGMMIFAKK